MTIEVLLSYSIVLTYKELILVLLPRQQSFVHVLCHTLEEASDQFLLVLGTDFQLRRRTGQNSCFTI